MCGIIAVLRRRSGKAPPPTAILDTAVAAATAALAPGFGADELAAAATALQELDVALRGVAGLRCLLAAADAAARCRRQLDALWQRVADFERTLDQGPAADAPDDSLARGLERRNAALVRFKDALWAVRFDRLPHADAVRDLGGGDLPADAVAAFSGIQIALSALDRLEVRGRDSAGVSVLVTGVDVRAPALQPLLRNRAADPLFQNRSVRTAGGAIDLV